MYTIALAARATGQSKTTIRRAIADGHLAAIRDEQQGGWRIDPAELDRVYPAPGGSDVKSAPDPGVDASPETVALHQLLREREETIADLRRRLDIATDALVEQSGSETPLEARLMAESVERLLREVET